ncbi:MAG: YhcN/YlaJ family sporulation lipoprotein [Candidatus Saccharibacteria bacterium]
MKKIITILVMLMIVSGCSQPPAKKPQDSSQHKTEVRIDREYANQVKEAAKSVKGVQDAASVVVDKDISLAIKVSGLPRLRLKSIKAQVAAKITSLDKTYTPHITSDKKLFSELQKIEKRINTGIEDSVKVKQDIEKINKAMNG